MSEPVPWVGLAALVAMVTEPWWRGLLERGPRPRRLRVPPGLVSRRGPVRGELSRLTRDGIVAGGLEAWEATPPRARVREIEGRDRGR